MKTLNEINNFPDSLSFPKSKTNFVKLLKSMIIVTEQIRKTENNYQNTSNELAVNKSNKIMTAGNLKNVNKDQLAPDVLTVLA